MSRSIDGDVLARLIHTLRRPLSPLTHALQLLELERPASPERVAYLHGLMQRQVEGLARTLDDVLEAWSLAEGEVHLEPRPLDLSSLVETTCAEHCPADRELRLSLPPAPVRLEGDAERLQTLLRHLIENAVRHAGVGGWIALGLSVEAERVLLRLEDSGPGFAEAPPEPCELFQQGPEALDGVGVGLTLAREVARLHGGELRLGEGQGGALVVSLPLRAG